MATPIPSNGYIPGALVVLPTYSGVLGCQPDLSEFEIKFRCWLRTHAIPIDSHRALDCLVLALTDQAAAWLRAAESPLETLSFETAMLLLHGKFSGASRLHLELLASNSLLARVRYGAPGYESVLAVWRDFERFVPKGDDGAQEAAFIRCFEDVDELVASMQVEGRVLDDLVAIAFAHEASASPRLARVNSTRVVPGIPRQDNDENAPVAELTLARLLRSRRAGFPREPEPVFPAHLDLSITTSDPTPDQSSSFDIATYTFPVSRTSMSDTSFPSPPARQILDNIFFDKDFVLRPRRQSLDQARPRSHTERLARLSTALPYLTEDILAAQLSSPTHVRSATIDSTQTLIPRRDSGQPSPPLGHVEELPRVLTPQRSPSLSEERDFHLRQYREISGEVREAFNLSSSTLLITADPPEEARRSVAGRDALELGSAAQLRTLSPGYRMPSLILEVLESDLSGDSEAELFIKNLAIIAEQEKRPTSRGALPILAPDSGKGGAGVGGRAPNKLIRRSHSSTGVVLDNYFNPGDNRSASRTSLGDGLGRRRTFSLKSWFSLSKSKDTAEPLRSLMV